MVDLKGVTSDVTRFMARVVPAASLETPLREVCKLMREYRCSYIVIADEGRPLGIITESDIVHRAVPEEMSFMSTPARNLMSQPVVTIDYTETMDDANALMKTLGFRHIVVVGEDKKVVGMVTLLGLLRYFEERGLK